jgi:hypothetical protein
LPAVGFSTAAVLATVLTFNGPLAMLMWPGLLVVNAACAWFGIYASGDFGPMFMAGLLIDIAIYTLLFFVMVKGWRMLVPKVVTKR